jgi:hypothetical protein
MPQQRFEEYGPASAIASEKAADWLMAGPAQSLQQQHEDQKTTQDIEAEKQKAQKKQQSQQGPKPKRKKKATKHRKK